MLAPLLVLSLTVFIANASPRSTPRPLVIWHGLGDSYESPGMLEFASLLKEMFPGMYVHSIYMDEDNEKDKEAGFYGYVNDQIDFAAEQIRNVTELGAGFDAIGFSQGGQFLRAYVERYNQPPVNNLLTFGSQHMGVSDIPLCKPYDILCQIARRLTKGAAYSEWAQTNLVTAQYYRDPTNYNTYLESNTFLPYINNEIEDERNATYAKNFASLNKLGLVLFTHDKTVVPKESSWFGSEAIQNSSDLQTIPGSQTPLQSPMDDDPVKIPMRMQPLYTEDWIGLKELDERGSVVFETCEGEHMQLNECWRDLVSKYIGEAV